MTLSDFIYRIEGEVEDAHVLDSQLNVVIKDERGRMFSFAGASADGEGNIVLHLEVVA